MRLMNLYPRLARVWAVAMVIGACCQATANTYVVDGQANVIGSQMENAVWVDIPPGEYTFTLTASDFRENYGNPYPQRHVVVLGDSNWGDDRAFSLNGVGDSRSVYVAVAGPCRLFFIDGYPWGDNTGSSTVEISAGDTPDTYTVDGETNVIGGADLGNAVDVQVSPGLYTFTLTASDFRENYGNPYPQRHVVVLGDSNWGDDRAFSLNGVGDSRTLYVPGPCKLFFIDAPPWGDNAGSSSVQIVPSEGCVADLDGDGDTDQSDLGILLADWGCQSNCAADLDGDGDTDQSDLGILLADWGCVIVDSDGDRLLDSWETNDGVYRDPHHTGTDPLDPDTDDDGLMDGDEVLGTLQYLDLPAMGANPLRQDVFIECDWVHGGDKNRPDLNQVARAVTSFGDAPVVNRDGSTGITLHFDYGQAPYGGGNAAADPNGDSMVNNDGWQLDGEFNQIKDGNFAANRHGYFHYIINCDSYGVGGNWVNSSGLAELPGDDFLVSMGQWATGDDDKIGNTIMHELGHNLTLLHGGVDSRNFKPNYNSIMNYRYQMCGIDGDADTLPDGLLDYSWGQYIRLDEANLDEFQGVNGSLAIDWNRDGQIQQGVQWNLNCRPTNTYANSSCGSHSRQDVVCGGNGGGLCDDSVCDIMDDFDDWGYVELWHLGDSDLLAPQVIHCVQE